MGTHVGHTAEILSATSKMYHTQLDNSTVTKVKKTNVWVIRAPLQKSQGNSDEHQPRNNAPIFCTRDNSQPSAIISSSDSPGSSQSSRSSPSSTTRQRVRQECERRISQALEEIHRQASIVAEFSEQMGRLSLEEEASPP